MYAPMSNNLVQNLCADIYGALSLVTREIIINWDNLLIFWKNGTIPASFRLSLSLSD